MLLLEYHFSLSYKHIKTVSLKNMEPTQNIGPMLLFVL